MDAQRGSLDAVGVLFGIHVWAVRALRWSSATADRLLSSLAQAGAGSEAPPAAGRGCYSRRALQGQDFSLRQRDHLAKKGVDVTMRLVWYLHRVMVSGSQTVSRRSI